MNKIGLAECCTKTQENLKAFLKAELIERGYSPIDQDGFLYAEGELPVMLTAHMDTVHHDNCTIVCTSPDGKYWMSPQGIGGDDRCGIYAIMKVAETHKVSILFTEDEETGCVGAKKYEKAIKANPESELIPKNLNYIIEIDRKNADDAVFYDCNNEDFEKFVTEDTGFKTASGSCSDISYVAPALGVAAVNFSSGYYNPHQTCEYINLEELHETIRRIKAIIDKPSEKFEYIEGRKKWSYSSYSSYGSSKYQYDDYDYGYWSRYDNKEPEENFAFEDFAHDNGLWADDLICKMDEMSTFWIYILHKESDDKDYIYKPEKTDKGKFFIDADFEVYEYDPTLKVMVSSGFTVVGRKYTDEGKEQEPYFSTYSASMYYVCPNDLYEEFFDFYMENADYYAIYENDTDDDVPPADISADDDIEKKDEMEEDILKLYN